MPYYGFGYNAAAVFGAVPIDNLYDMQAYVDQELQAAYNVCPNSASRYEPVLNFISDQLGRGVVDDSVVMDQAVQLLVNARQPCAAEKLSRTGKATPGSSSPVEDVKVVLPSSSGAAPPPPTTDFLVIKDTPSGGFPWWLLLAGGAGLFLLVGKGKKKKGS